MGVQLTDEMIKGAQKSESMYGIPASITLGQIILESSGKYAGGLSGLAYNDKNLFGIKGTGTAGTAYYPTKEEVNGKTVTVQAGFRKYNNFEESITDHALLLTKPRYAEQFKNASSVNDFAEGLQKAGYATSSSYANNLLKVIGNNNLTQYDKGNYQYKAVSNESTASPSAPPSKNESDTKTNLFGSIVRVVLILIVFLIGVMLFTKAFDIQIPKFAPVKISKGEKV